MGKIFINQKPGGKPHEGLFHFNGQTLNCSLGRSGITSLKREGDGATPIGRYKILYGFFRKDRINRIQSRVDFEEITKNSGWCDAPDHANYNQYVRLPFSASHEKMLRDDRLYDICIVLDYNISPRKRNAGSAIFFHQSTEDMSATEGCIAISPDHMRLILPELTDQTEIIIRR